MARLRRLLGRGLFLLAVVIVLSAVLAVFLAIEAEPRELAAEKPTAREIHRLKKTLERQDPRRLASGAIGTLSLSERELGIAVSQSLQVLGLGREVVVDLEQGELDLQASLELPTDLERRFVNVEASMRETDGLPRFESLRLGRTRIPAPLANAAWRPAAAAWLRRVRSPGALDMVQHVALGADRIDVTYRWQPWTVDRLRAGLVSDVDRKRLRAYAERLAAVTADNRSGRIPLAELLGSLFELAAERSRDGKATTQNRAAILVLGLYVDGRRMESLLPEAAEWSRPRMLEATLHRQHDLARHYMTSSLLASLTGSGLSNALGLYKELEDGRGGSGFSFQDLAADRAGTRFGELATGSEKAARRVQGLLAAGMTDGELLPEVRDLPDGLSQSEFENLVGEVGSEEYRRLTDEIEERLDALPLYGGP